MTFGTMAWAASSGGRLRGLERVGQMIEAIRFQLRQRFKRNPRVLGGSSPFEVDRMLGALVLPDSPLVHRTASIITELGPKPLAAHALRTWAWGRLIGLRDGLSIDPEVFALAALMHDIGLAQRNPVATCFAADGAQQAVGLLRSWNAPDDVVAAVGDAICLHVRVAVPPTLGAEAHLVHAGAAMDLLGSGRSTIPRQVRERVLSSYPRGAAKEFFKDCFERELRDHPDSRIGLWVKLGFVDRINAAPYES